MKTKVRETKKKSDQPLSPMKRQRSSHVSSENKQQQTTTLSRTVREANTNSYKAKQNKKLQGEINYVVQYLIEKEERNRSC